MRLRTKLVLATTLFTLVLTLALSLIFFAELVRERIAQTEAANDVLVHQVLLSAREAVEHGIAAHPPKDNSEAAFEAAVASLLQNDPAVLQTIDGIVRYSPAVEDAYISGANGRVLVSSDPLMVQKETPRRIRFDALSAGSFSTKRELVFGAPKVLDVALSLQRNRQPFLFAHVGLRSTFLRNAYIPLLRDAALFAFLALIGCLFAAALLSAAALRPIEQISRDLDRLSSRSGEPDTRAPVSGLSSLDVRTGDAVQRVSSTITRIDEQIRSSEQTRTELASNLNQMLQTLKDGVMLFSADGKIAMASDSVDNFLPADRHAIRGATLNDVFPAHTAIASVLAPALAQRRAIHDLPVQLEDGRAVELTLDPLGADGLGALLTLHDAAAEEEIAREIELSRRLASIGRLTAGVGHEVKNPINAMVVHLELLRSKLGAGAHSDGIARHVEVLASEMSRLDRVVQTLADFSKPLEPVFEEQELAPIVAAVVQLVSAEADVKEIAIGVTTDDPSLRVVADAELLRQALLNVVLNGMQAMPDGGVVHIDLQRDGHSAVIAIRDTGTGIEPDKLNHIFDLYFTTKATGSGIGLSMTYRIVQMHGGTIEAESEADPDSPIRGTLFRVRLPITSRATLQVQR